jgi:hypothetical protein
LPWLEIINSGYKVALPLDSNSDAIQPLADMTGGHRTYGVLPAPMSSSNITCTFLFANNWLLANGYTPDINGLWAANIDFDEYCIQGGLGVLVNTLPPGFHHPRTGNLITSAWAYASYNGEQDRSDDSNVHVTWAVTIEFSEWLAWNLSDGSQCTIGGLL